MNTHVSKTVNPQQCFFSDLSGEGNPNTETITSITQATDSNLLTLQGIFEIKID